MHEPAVKHASPLPSRTPASIDFSIKQFVCLLQCPFPGKVDDFYFVEPLYVFTEKGLSFNSNRQWRKEGASELAGIEPTPPALEEKGMPYYTNFSQKKPSN
jgi:hypothetical protein